MKYVINFFVLILFLSCSQVEKLGDTKHSMGKKYENIFWIQIPGFSKEHIALLKLTDWSPSKGEQLSNFSCFGEVWDYSLFDLRPKSSLVLNSQIAGDSFQKNSCEDFKLKPFYHHEKFKNYSKILIEESVSKDESLSSSKTCKDSNWLDNMFYLSRSEGKSELEPFHVTHSKELESNIYQDQSCLKDKCYNSITSVLNSLESRFMEEQSIFIYRNYRYEKLLESRLYKNAQEVLLEIEELITYIKKYYSKKSLILLSGGASINLEYPRQGMDWGNLTSTLVSKKRSLLSPIFSFGAGAERFCGIHEFNNIAHEIIHE